jgi:RimJ/RimL family protein N-acetyltransferase
MLEPTISADLTDPPETGQPLSDQQLAGRYLFYCSTGVIPKNLSPTLPYPYSYAIWRPSPLRVWPPNTRGIKLKLRFLFRWILHQLHIFAGRNSGILVVYADTLLVHYSGFTPRYWRFPFLSDADLQIGDTWTHPAYRGQGLALFALQTIMQAESRPGRRFWYVVEAINAPSIRVVEKAGFCLAGEGAFVKRWGMKLSGAYVMSAHPWLKNQPDR